jgi:hypothetical protein
MKYGGPLTMSKMLQCDACLKREGRLWLHPRLGFVQRVIGRCSDGLNICDECDIKDALATKRGISDA